jgi:ParB-like chromosome segregation protein Spo0J
MSSIPEPAPEFKFHPLADIFPLMEGAEFDALVADIKANGLRDNIDLYQGMIIDGRNRYRACLKAGVTCRAHEVLVRAGCSLDLLADDAAALAYVISKNIHRRHLTADQKRDLIAKLLKAAPEKSDRQIAKAVKASPTFVGKVRAEKEATGDVSTVDTRTDTKGRKQPAKRARERERHKRRLGREQREQKKQADLINETVRESQPAIDALVARLVKLDPKVARGVLEAIAMFGPCGAVEGPNFILALPFALALEAALNALEDAAGPAACAGAPAADGLDIPECLRRDRVSS